MPDRNLKQENATRPYPAGVDHRLQDMDDEVDDSSAVQASDSSRALKVRRHAVAVLIEQAAASSESAELKPGPRSGSPARGLGGS